MKQTVMPKMKSVDEEKELVYEKHAQKIPVHDDFFRTIVESSHDAIVVQDRGGVIMTWNRGAEEMYGYTEDEVIGRLIYLIVPTAQKKELSIIMNEVIAGKTLTYFETQRVHKNGTLIDVSYTISPIKNGAGKIIGISTVGRDISARKRVEKNLRFLAEASKKLSSSLDYKKTLRTVAKLSVPYIADWCSISIKSGNKIKQLIVSHKDPEKARRVGQISKKYISDPTDRRGVNLQSAMLVPLINHKKIIGAITFVSAENGYQYTKQDLEMAEELAKRAVYAIENSKLYNETQNALLLRDEFISIASHELKTPLTGMKMYLQALQIKVAKETGKESIDYITKIDNQINKLTILINDMLNVSRLQHERFNLNFEQFYIEEPINDIIETLEPMIKNHKIITQGKISKKVYADKYRIQQVVANLLTNALKYSPKDKEIYIKLIDEESCAKVSVQDFGIGIDKEHLGKLFRQFYRVKINRKGNSYPGLGMGLYISNQIIKQHGGSMDVSSKKGEGSIFSFTLPYKNQ